MSLNNLLQDEGLIELRSGRFRPSEHREHSYLFLTHTLAVTDFLISALLLSRTYPEVVVAEMQHERDLRRMPAKVKSATGEPITVIPDAWVDLHLFKKTRMALVLELDRGTEQQTAFLRKVRGLLAYANGSYQERYHTNSLTILVATTAGDLRAHQLLRWIEQVLTEQQATSEADLFLVANITQPTLLDPQSLFLSPLWREPFHTGSALPLIDVTVLRAPNLDPQGDIILP